MPKLYKRRRLYKRKARRVRALTEVQKTQVKAIIDRRSDTKTRFGLVPPLYVAVPNLLTAATANDVTNITRYDAGGADKDQCRIGDRIKIKSIRLFGAIKDPNGAATAIRVMLVRHNKNAGTSINPNDVIQTNAPSWAPYSQLEHNTPYQVLFDRKFNFGYNATHYSIDRTLRFKNPLLVEYAPSSTGGTPLDIVTGNITLFVAADTASAGALPQEWLTFEVNFFDF